MKGNTLSLLAEYSTYCGHLSKERIEEVHGSYPSKSGQRKSFKTLTLTMLVSIFVLVFPLSAGAQLSEILHPSKNFSVSMGVFHMF